MSAGEIYWDIVPYVALVALIVGTWWRYRYDKFGWTTRSSQLYENRLLRIGSPLFHFGMLVVILGHFIGLVIPESWTEAVGISEHMYTGARRFRASSRVSRRCSAWLCWSTVGAPGVPCSARPLSTTKSCMSCWSPRSSPGSARR